MTLIAFESRSGGIGFRKVGYVAATRLEGEAPDSQR